MYRASVDDIATGPNVGQINCSVETDEKAQAIIVTPTSLKRPVTEPVQ